MIVRHARIRRTEVDLYMPPSQGTCATLDCPEDAIGEPLLYTSDPAEKHFRSPTRVIKNPKLLIVIYVNVRTLASRNHEQYHSMHCLRQKHYCLRVSQPRAHVYNATNTMQCLRTKSADYV